MSAQTIRNALGVLQEDPDNGRAWADLGEAVGYSRQSGISQPPEGVPPESSELSKEELATLLEGARRAHELRREYEAVARLLQWEVEIAKGTEREAALVAELARVLDEELLDDEGSSLAYMHLLELRPGERTATEALDRAEGKRTKWFEIVKRYVDEAKSTKDPAFKSSLFVTGAEAAYRYGRPQLQGEGQKGQKKLEALEGEIVTGLKKALDIDPKNRRAAILLERVYRQRGEHAKVAEVLDQLARESTIKEEKSAAYLRLARVYAKRLDDPEKAIQAYQAVVDIAPGNVEATAALVDRFTERKEWDNLVGLYEDQLAAGSFAPGQEAGILLQIAMVHWKMREKTDAAEPYFTRLRKIEPAHPQMLTFFRQWCAEKGEIGRLTQILTDAQRVLTDGPTRATLVAELAQLAEDGANATRAIEQWRSLLRQDPNNKEARAALKRLYRQTGGWNALADLLRGDLEKVGVEDKEARLPILRDIAAIYRNDLKNDSALVTVLSQISTLDPTDKDAARELARVYAALGRWREMLATQARVAELETDVGARTEIYREVARRWLEQFSNMQNAVDAYEKLLDASPDDREANQKLRELYTKRRAYKPLYDLLARQVERMEAAPAEAPAPAAEGEDAGEGASAAAAGEERRALWLEMAKLAADRLDRGPDAVIAYKKVLAEEPSSQVALDALEKLADREKDYATVAEVLERRVELAAGTPGGTQTQLAILQKLGSIYADRLHDPKGSMRAWRRVLDLSPGHPKALRVLRDTFLANADYDGLTELYATTEDFEGLAEVLSSAADRTPDPDAKIELSYRAADVYVDRLRAPERAFRAYERVLGVRPDDKRAAAALVPLYEREEKWARLPPLYEVLLRHAEEREEKLALLHKLAHITGHNLSDRAGSFAYARRAYELDPGREGALGTFEKATRASGEWAAFVEALNARLKDTKLGPSVTPEELDARRTLRSKIAEVYALELGRVDDAIVAYRSLVEDNPDDEEIVGSLDRLLRSESRRDDLRWLFEHRVSRANTSWKIHLYAEWATLEEDVFGDPDQAIAIYRKILELVPQHGTALRSLARLLRAQGDPAGAAEALEKDRDQREGMERAQREVELARLYMTELKRPLDALAAGQRALDLVPRPPPGSPAGSGSAEYRGAVEVIEELLHVPETRGRAAVLLEAHYDETGNAQQQAEVLEVMIATAAAKKDRIALYSRLADVYEGKVGAATTAFDVIARAASEFPMELELWDRLAVLSNRTHRAHHFVSAIVEAVPPLGETGLPETVEMDLAERAATLYDEMLGDIVSAQPYLERILTRDPGNERAFARLKQILTTLERWEELEGLYERAISAAPDLNRRADLLADVALVAEEITGDRPKAIAYYERILQLEPNHEQTVRALDSLYSGEERWTSLAALLQNRLPTASLDEAVALKLRLGSLYISRLEDPATAIGFLEDVLQADPTNREARDLTEKCLTVPGLRPRAASILEQVYIALDAPRDLVRILEVRLETASMLEERRELLRRIAELRDDRLQEGAFDVYARLVPIAPDDVEARAGLLTLAKKLGAFEEAARVLAESADAAGVPQPRAQILSELAQLLERHLGDAERAEAVYRQVLVIGPDDTELALPIARSLERIYAASGRTRDLAEILRTEVKLEEDPAARREIQGRLGELCETSLDDPKGAIDAWRARLDDDPLDSAALGALDRLYERTGEWRALVEILRARERQVGDAPQRRRFMERVASTLADRLSDVPEAILAYRALVDEFGPDDGALSALERLYETAERWPDLAETIEARLSIADGEESRLGLLAKLGAVRRERLDEVPQAIEAFRQALMIEATHAPSRTALEGLLEHPDVRREVAGILRPLYEADGQEESLLRVIDIEAEYAEEREARLGLYREAARAAEVTLGDPRRAFGYSLRALREAESAEEFLPWLERAERLAQAVGAYGELVDLLRLVVPDLVDGDLQVTVTLKIASLLRDALADKAGARSYYVRALELRGDDRTALEALEALYEEANDPTSLLEILRRRAEVADDDSERRRILFKQARLSDETLHDPTGAIDTYRLIHDAYQDDTAFLALERLYTATERWDDLISLYEGRIAKGPPGEVKAGLHHKLGEVYETRLGEHHRAFDQYEAALSFDSRHPATVASLEGLMGDRAHAARAAEMLEHVYLARHDWRRVMATLEARLDVSEDPDEKRQLLRRLAGLHEEQAENYPAALETTAKLLAEDLTDEPTWHELDRLARVANAEARLAEIYATELGKVTADEPATAKLARRTGQLYEQLGDTDRALSFYRRAHAFAPEEDDVSFESIDRILRETGQSQARVDLYRSALEYREDPAARLATLHTIARLQEIELQSDDLAIETYGQALEVEETDVTSLEALARLYDRRGRYGDLADLTRRRAEHSALPDDEAKFRIVLGKLLQEKLHDTASAIDEYETVVELAPGTAAANEAIAALEALIADPEHKAHVVDILRPIYERADDWRHLVSVNLERLGIADDDSERVAILRETARLWETRGRDPNQAFDSVRDAFVLDPDDGDTRAELDRLAEVTSRWDHLANAYQRGIERTSGITEKELLGALARLHNERRDDPRAALDAYDRLFRADETDIEPLEQMDELATLLADWTMLERVLRKRAELTTDDERRASTWRRIGEVRRDMLEDAAGSIDAFEHALELEPDNAFTMDRLIELYEAKNDPARLINLYRRRVELCTDDEADLKFQLYIDAANGYEFGLHDRREAIEVLDLALSVRPGDVDVVRRLDKLYTAEKMWHELLENLRQQVVMTEDEAEGRTLRKRIGALLAHELDDAPQALTAYREVLEGGAFDEEAAKAIRELGEGRDELRGEAADALEPVLRKAERHEELLQVLEMRLRSQIEPSERTQTLRAIAEVAEQKLDDLERAEAALLRALSEAPEDASLHAEIERICGRGVAAAGKKSESWQRYADALSERAGSLFDANVATDLFMRLGRVAEEKLVDDARAARAYVSAAEQSGDNEAVLSALDRLFGRLGDARALADVLERRIAVEATPGAQADLYHRLATLQIREFEEPSKGLSTLRLAVEQVPDHGPSRDAMEALLEKGDLFDEAFEALESVYRTLGRTSDLARLYERKVTRAPGVRERSRARLDLARVLEIDAKDLLGAQRVLEAALVDDLTDVDVLSEAERIAGSPGGNGFGSLTEALAQALVASENKPAKDVPTHTAAELWVRLGTWRRDELKTLEVAEEAFVKALSLEPENVDVLRALEDLRRAPGRERDLVETLRTRARLETDLQLLGELLREAKEIAETKLDDPALAESALRDWLTEDEGNLWALEELTKLRERAGDHKEVIELLLRRSEMEADGPKIASLKHRAAEVMTSKAGDIAGAIKLYEELRDSDPTDAAASSKLRELYAQAGRSGDLARLLQDLIDAAESPEQRTLLRLDLSKLEMELDRSTEAIDTLRAILDEVPAHGEAVLALSTLFERTGQDEELAELLNTQIERAERDQDATKELALKVRLGEVFETRLKDTPRALATFEGVLEREPEHRAALEAVARLAESRSEWERASTALSTLTRVVPDDAGVKFALRLANARAKLGDEDGVPAALRRALEIQPGNEEVREQLRAFYERKRSWTELAALLVGDAELVAKEHPDVLLAPADISGNAGGRPISVPPGARPSRPSPAPVSSAPPPMGGARAEYVRLLRRAAEIHIRERNSEADAVPLLEQLAKTAPHDRELLLLLCDAYTAAGRERDATQVLEKVISSYGAKRSKELSVYHHRLGKALASLGDKDVALVQYDMAFKIDPGSVNVLRDLGVLAFETNDLDRAQKTFRALLLQRLDNSTGISKGEVFYYLGEISAKQGDKAKAVQMLERAIENEPSLDRAKAKLEELKG
ncbi:tetratricopeptide repeat protein [Pendulispora albinea]|uniref:Tetratricopeptide repeat protein n=1 Tax=Pendulispora albinea TaxID=2741071 RepID=A0ABZ2LMZ4_9BACT